MKYLKLKNRMIGNCLGFRVAGGKIKWAEMGCAIETVQRLGKVFVDINETQISLIPISDENNALILAAIEDTNGNDFPEDTAEIVNQEEYDATLLTKKEDPIKEA